MQISVQAELQYRFAEPTDALLQVEAAIIPEQSVSNAHIDVTPTEHFARVRGHDDIGERIWIRTQGDLRVQYQATVAIERLAADCAALPMTPQHLLPSETVEYLFPSRYCPSDLFEMLVDDEFAGLQGGARVVAIRDWIEGHLAYLPGSSDASTTAMESYVQRQGVCRDFAHVMIALVRASAIPARFASVYALGVEPQDFHAVAEVFLDGAWYLFDPTGMAKPGEMAKIGVGRDAADVSFLTSYGQAEFVGQTVTVRAG
jgi:transglutaminase-like putative cysteine protease